MDGGEEVMIIDVHHSLDFEADPYLVPGSVRILSEELDSPPEVPKDREVVVYCT